MESQEVFSLAKIAGFLQCALGCLMRPRTAPAPFVNLDPLFKLVFGELGNLTALAEVMFSALAVGTVWLTLGFLLCRTIIFS